MHYHNVFLVRAKSRTEAIQKVEEFLIPFYEKEYDWYQFGGRWMWSDLVKKYMDKIAKFDEEHKVWVYLNPYHNPEIKGKTVVIEFPDGTKVKAEYGSSVEYAIKDWVGRHPGLSEVKDATDPEFFNIIEQMRKAAEDELSWYKKFLGEETDEEMKKYYKEQVKLLSEKPRWMVEMHFWNITENSFNYDRDEILKDPRHWFIVNVDLHS